MPSDLKLTAAGILAHVLETSGIHVGTTIDRKDLENMAASLDGQLSALIAAAERADAAEKRVRELEEALEDFRDYGLRADLSPTMCHKSGVHDENYQSYLRSLDNSVRDRARTALGKEPRPTTGESLIAGLTDLRDTLQRGESLGAHYKITYHNPPRPPGDTTEPRP